MGAVRYDVLRAPCENLVMIAFAVAAIPSLILILQ